MLGCYKYVHLIMYIIAAVLCEIQKVIYGNMLQ